MSRSATLVDRLAMRLDPDRPDRTGRRPRPDTEGRRSFLATAAVVGAALATNPLQWILKPGTAYANVCGDGVGCGTGWTVFCCTVNEGANTCPPGSFAAGWWKADASAFCGGAARYYVDCNRLPSDPAACSCVGCHSGNGTCDQRRYCCNVFRYGQCHLEIAGVTPVVCRVITCTPPWQWDPGCSSSPRTDNRTGQHTAPCLPGPGASAITLKYQDLGMVGSPLGRQLTVEEAAPGGGARVTFEHGQIHWRADLAANGSWGPIHDTWSGELGGPTGSIGYPRSDTTAAAGDGAQQDFEGASLFWSEATGVQQVQGAILDAYRRVGGPTGMGYPLAGEEAGPQDGRQSRFERGVVSWRDDLGAHAVFGGIHERWDVVGADAVGLPWTDALPVAGRGFEQGFALGAAIFWSPDTGGHDVREPLLARYRRAGGPGGGMGFPIAPTEPVADGGQQSRFERGTVTAGPGLGIRAVFGAIHERWTALGGADGRVGLPWSDELSVGDRQGRVQWFTGAAIFWSPGTGAHDVAEPILSTYRSRGGPAGSLGYPVGDTEQVEGGGTRSRFERGTLTADAAGTVSG